MSSHYRYSAEIFTRDGRQLGRFPLEVDWVPAIECAHFELVRQGLCLPRMQPGPVGIEPVWDVTGTAVAGISLNLQGADQTNVSFTLSNAYLRDAVIRLPAAQGMRGMPGAFGTFDCRFRAEALPHSGNEPQAEDFSVEAIQNPLAVQVCRMHSIIDACPGCDDAFAREGDLPVFIAREVITQARELACADNQQEAGGFLLGYLCRDPDNSAYFLLVTGQIRAAHTCPMHDSLTFTTGTWSHLHTELGQRARQEQLLGWWHSHPFFCRNCQGVERGSCPLSRPFFSGDDRALHRTVFQKAYQIALLLSFLDEGSAPQVDLFGWHCGQVAMREYIVISENPGSWNWPHTRSPVDVTCNPTRCNHANDE